jgi:predicted RNase H-like HicB family nuclease
MDAIEFSAYFSKFSKEVGMKTFTAVIERCPDTRLYVGYVPGFPGAHSQGATLDELNGNLKEVIEMLLEEAEPKFESEFVGTQNVAVG